MVATLTAWEYRGVGAPRGCDFAPIGQLMDKLGAEGWEFCGSLTGTADVPPVPADLRGNGHIANGGAHVLNAGGKAEVVYLIFKRPKAEEESA